MSAMRFRVHPLSTPIAHSHMQWALYEIIIFIEFYILALFVRPAFLVDLCTILYCMIIVMFEVSL